MERISHIVNVVIQLPNAAVQPSFGMPIYLTTVQVIAKDGQQIGQATHLQQPAIPADITDDILGAINAQMATLGLTVTRANG